MVNQSGVEQEWGLEDQADDWLKRKAGNGQSAKCGWNERGRIGV